MRNFKKYGIPIIIAALCICLFNAAMNYALIPYSYVRIMMHDLQTESNDIVFLGTSHGLSGISPKVIEEKTGKKAINLCMGGEYPKDAYFLLKEAVRNHKPEEVVYELDPGYWCTEENQSGDFNRIYYEMPWSLVKLEYFAAKTLKSDFRTALFPWFYYRSRYSQMQSNIKLKQSSVYKNYGAEPFTNPGQSYGDGFVKRNEVPGVKAPDGLVFWDETLLKEEAVKYFEKMAALCKKEGINFTVITTPIPEEALKEHPEYEKADAFFQKYMKEQGIAYYNYNRAEYPIAGFDKSLNAFTDYEGHMSWKQAEIFSRQLAEDLW